MDGETKENLLTDCIPPYFPFVKEESKVKALALCKIQKNTKLLEIQRKKKECELELDYLTRDEKHIQNTEEHSFLHRHYSILKKMESYDPDYLRYLLSLDTWSIYSGLAILCDMNPSSVCFDESGNIYPNKERAERYEKTRMGQDAQKNRKPDELHVILLDGISANDEALGEILFFLDCEELGVEPGDFEYDFDPYSNNLVFQSNYLEAYYAALGIWESGYHADRRFPPQYFIDWAVSKNMPPQWLDWAKENNLIGESKKENHGKKEVNAKSETAFLNIVGALFGELLKEKQKENPKITQTSLIEILAESYVGYSGLSLSNLKSKIPEAIRRIQIT